MLKEIATIGNGFYLPLQGAKTMDTLYEQGLAKLPKTELSSRLVQRYHERYHWPLAIAIVLAKEGLAPAVLVKIRHK